MMVSESEDMNVEKVYVPVNRYIKDDSIENGMRINPTMGVMRRFERGEMSEK